MLPRPPTSLLWLLALLSFAALDVACDTPRRGGGGGGGSEGEGEGTEGEGEGTEGEGEGTEGEGEGTEGEGEGTEGEGEGAPDCGPQAFADCSWTQGLCASALPRCAPGRGWVCEPLPPAPFEAGAEISCDGLDNDCDGQTDEQLVPPSADLTDGVCAGAVQECAGPLGWSEPDYSLILNGYEREERSCDGLDNDCDGRVDEAVVAPPGVCLATGVCAEGSAECRGAQGWRCALPADHETPETSCDGRDNDCDGQTDEPGDLIVPAASRCLSVGVCQGTAAACDGQWRCDYPAGREPTELSCDGQDNDCDGQTDEGLSPDQDGDGHHPPGSCRSPADDCDDRQRTVFAGAPELLDGRDNDCDGQTDCDDETAPPECPGCINASAAAWQLDGEQYCQRVGLHCAGATWWSDQGCSTGQYELCSASTPLRCCSYNLPDMMGAAGSALWRCEADCPVGSEVGPAGSCVDIDECAENIDGCSVQATCENRVGDWLCVCRLGFSGDGFSCTASPAAPGCLLPTEAYWRLTGTQYCARFGKTCAGLDYFVQSNQCSGSVFHPGADPGTCEHDITYYMGANPEHSAAWRCL